MTDSTISFITQIEAHNTSQSATRKGLIEAGVARSVGMSGDSYDNALAESVMGLYKTELVRKKGPWKTIDIDELGIATLEWVEWYNHRRIHSTTDRPALSRSRTLRRNSGGNSWACRPLLGVISMTVQ
jgi:transposase InsO family protein